MSQIETPFQSEDIPAALGLLSRIPVRVNPDWVADRGARSAWAYPLCGAVVGALIGLVALASLSLGFSPEITAGFALVASVMITGALHEDGLADTADGLWGGQTPERRLEIMKDSRIGAYGVIALVLSLLIRWSALAVLFDAGYVFWALIGIGALSRVPLTVMMQTIEGARKEGLSANQGKPGESATLGALGIGAVIGVLGIGSSVFPAVIFAGMLVYGLCQLAKRKIGGQTGDILGAGQQVAEIAVLTVLVAPL